MKNILFLILICLFFYTRSYSQSVFYDSKTLSRMFSTGNWSSNTDSVNKVSKILQIYIKNSNNQEQWLIMQIYSTNPFFKMYPDLLKKLNSLSNNTAGQNPIPNISSIVSSVGGLDVTQYVQAAANIMETHIKEELQIAFIDKFKRDFEASVELQKLFPNTYTLIENQDIFSIPSMGQVWKSAFMSDIKNLPDDFLSMVNSSDDPDLRKIAVDPIFLIFEMSLQGTEMLNSGSHPIDILNYLDITYGDTVHPVKQELRFLNLVSQGLKSNNDSTGWVSLIDFKKMNIDEFNIFLGLLYQENPAIFNNIKIGNPSKSLIEILTTGNAQLFEVSLQRGLILFNQVDNSIKSVNNQIKKGTDKTNKIVEGAILQNLDLFANIIDFGENIVHFDDLPSYYNSDYYKTYRPVMYNAIACAKAINGKDYGSAFTSSINAFQPMINRIPSTSPSYSKYVKLAATLSTWANFMVDIINADSADQIANVMEKYAAPVGSYKVKRLSISSCDLNAFPGLYGGFESDFSHANSNAPSYGVTAPIGFSINWGVKDDAAKGSTNSFKMNGNYYQLNGASNSLFLSVFDIGAALSFAFAHDTMGLPQKIYLSQIFSPGIFYVYGFKNSPLSLKIGCQYAPLLRQITLTDNTLYNESPFRFSATLSVDIPFVNLYHKTVQDKNAGS